MAAKKRAKRVSKPARRKTSAKKVAKKAQKKTVKKVAATVRKKPRTKKTSRPNVPEQCVTISSDTGVPFVVTAGQGLQELAMRWRYTLSRRQRWRGSVRKEMREQAMEAILALCVDQRGRALERGEAIERVQATLSGASMVQVEVPYRNERALWEARVAPWEYLISATAHELGNRSKLAIVRHLRTAQAPRPSATQALRVLYVQCAPGELAGHYDFSTERASVERAFEGKVNAVIDPTLVGLRQAIAKHRPNVIHLAGIDNNQAKELLQDLGKLPSHWTSSEDKERDGLVFAAETIGDRLGVVPVDAETLASVLNSGPAAPVLVTANVYHSASRICALAVAEGAALALGFQDTVSDSLAEALLYDFYDAWAEQRQALPAFVGALDGARASVGLSGTGVVLWSKASLLDGATARVAEVRSRREGRRSQVLALGEDFSMWLHIDIEVRERLNYSLLHNDSGGLFRKLEIRKDKPGILPNVSVEVVLYLGSESHPYTAKFTLTEYLTQIDKLVKVPLTSAIIRSVGEPIRTSLLIRVSVGGTVLREETHRVTLLPADEWTDTDDDRIWLPSFVLPRDPQVAAIIDRAQKHLVTLADDQTRSFDGYQSVLEDDPESLADIDIQVQAIWAAVVNDLGIRYINPPPSYSRYGQRLRTPTQVVRGGRGTCIDLAMLLAACLEYVEIYPVIFLLDGHAFAGYWRSEGRYDQFMNARQRVDSDEVLESIGAAENQASWVLPSDSYAEILNEINSGYLYPLETVGFTTHGSFWQAVDEGIDNLRSRSEFHSLVDIWSARRGLITPLPIIDDLGVAHRGSAHDR